MARRILRWLGIATLVIGYPLLAHYTNESTQRGNLGALVAIAPVALLALVLVWRSSQRIVMLGVLGLACAALWAGWPALTHHFGMVYWLQYVSMQLVLLITFARTLIGGRQPLCTQFAAGGACTIDAAAGNLYPPDHRSLERVFCRDGLSLDLAVFPGTPGHMVGFR